MQIVKCKLNISVHCFTDASLVFNVSALSACTAASQGAFPSRPQAHCALTAMMSPTMLTPAFVGSDFPWLKVVNNNASTEHPGCVSLWHALVANTLEKSWIFLNYFFNVSMEILERYLPLRYTTCVLIYIFPNDCHFWPETVTTGTTMTHSKCQHETT